MNTSLVVVLTALNVEYTAVRERMTDLRVHRHPAGTRFELGRHGADGCRIALGLVGKGNHPAAVLTERAMAEFSPAAVIFVGVAGGLWPSVRLGDVVVASQVYAYHGGTSEDSGLKSRPRAWEIAHGAGQIAQHLIRNECWAAELFGGPAPQVHFGPIAAGEVVLDSAISDQARWVREHYNDALAIEMEAAGVAQAGHLNRCLPVLVVRGISDRADGDKAVADGQNWQPRAVAHAAAFAMVLADELAADSRHNAEAETEKGRPTPMDGTSKNIARDQAYVGVQAGHIHGNVTVGSESRQDADIASGIAQLREALKRAHRDGRLDEPTFIAAEKELDVASHCLTDNTVRSRSTFVVALKKVRGLVTDAADLAIKAAAIVAAAQGLS